MTLLNLCSERDKTIKEELSKTDILTDYAVEIRYPDDWYEPTIDEAREAIDLALVVKENIFVKLKLF